MVEVARRTSTTTPTGAAAASAGVNATWTRMDPGTLSPGYDGRHGVHRAGDDGLLSPPPRGDRRPVLELRTADLHRVHGLQRRLNQVPRVRRPAGRRETRDHSGPARRAHRYRGDRHQVAD